MTLKYIICPYCGEKIEIIVPETMEEYKDIVMFQRCEKCEKILPFEYTPIPNH